jgi:hypothetical protein
MGRMKSILVSQHLRNQKLLDQNAETPLYARSSEGHSSLEASLLVWSQVSCALWACYLTASRAEHREQVESDGRDEGDGEVGFYNME